MSRALYLEYARRSPWNSKTRAEWLRLAGATEADMRRTDKPLNFIHGKWHAWRGERGYLLSDEDTKTLRDFATFDDMVNWLWVTANDKPAARALNKHKPA